ncbi:hypothetical protein N7454_008173 [Penicillium verhagenii]|nr:hypothetical protein N7454_008173 [Penicillium verhagenii]
MAYRLLPKSGLEAYLLATPTGHPTPSEIGAELVTAKNQPAYLALELHPANQQLEHLETRSTTAATTHSCGVEKLRSVPL